MLKRINNSDGREITILIYEKHEHKINNNLIDRDAIKLIQKITAKGEKAYLVGGAVRDLILNKVPKDFDIATSMTPASLKKNFKNVKIIGRRFKLAHFLYPNSKILEVATFRSSSNNENTNNIFGTIEEDVHRRDFTINSLYYDPLSGRLYDFLSGYEDLKAHRLVSVIDLNTTFKEDPVRMIRAVKYAVKDNLVIDDDIKNKIIETSYLISTISTSRLAEELSKIFISGMSFDIFTRLQTYNILNYLLPKLSYDIKIKNPILKTNLRFFDTVVNNFEFDKSRIIELGIFSIIAHMFNNIKASDNVSADVIKRELTVQLKILFIHFNISNKTFENVAKLLINRTSIFFDNEIIKY